MADFWVIRFYDIDLASRSHRKHGLWVDIAMVKVQIETGVNGEVGLACIEASHNSSWDGRSPLMVAPWSKETLVDGSSDKRIFVKVFLLFTFITNLEHFLKRISIVLQPKLVPPLDIFVRSIVVRIRLWVVDYLIFIFVEGTRLFPDLTGKPIVPTRESEAGSWLITYIVIIINPLQCLWT